ncbi:hypothetical protein MNBD_DELTA01-636 [hydrothermal vent metagenome]|uniref:3-hydroxyacyl-[acyl-carrier-protein] dehydratase n=1 Tax=hydrothermal vent metagenome TaxID=652676 RepID=A0A3B0QVY2_9ZZZZ
MNAGSTERTLDETLTSLPHAYPFRLLDRLTEINETSATGIKAISAGDFFYGEDNATGSALPALLIAEALAQLSGLVMTNGRSDCPGAYLAGINELHLKRSARAGETLQLHAETIITFGTMARFSARAIIGAEEILKCELTMALNQEIKDKAQDQ